MTRAERSLKRLLDFSRGLNSSMRYERLKAAQDFAHARGLAFPAEAKAALRDAARETLAGALAFEQGRGRFV